MTTVEHEHDEVSPLEGTSYLPDADREHRQRFATYATAESSSEWHRAVLEQFYSAWGTWNSAFFGEGLVEPHILLSEPRNPRALGDYATTSGWGSPGQIRLRPSLLTGKHRTLRPGAEYAAGRLRFVLDVLLHETVHLYADEILQKPEDSYHGHGPVFASECNRIGETLGLPPVRPAKARGKNKDLPSCAQWPHNVRPADYYLGASTENAGSTEPVPGPQEWTLDEAVEALGSRVYTVFEKWPKEFLSVMWNQLISLGEELKETGDLRP